MSNGQPPVSEPDPGMEAAPKLDERTRARLGEQLKRPYDPIIEEQLDPHLVELLQLLAAKQ